MSTINKILKTLGVSALCNGVSTFIIVNNYPTAASFGPVICYAANTFFTTSPALVGFFIDKFVNQNITSNKTTQYGLTALESSLIFPGGISSLKVFNFTDLFSPSLKGNCGVSKLLTASTMGQSLVFKYIWDSSDETNPELNTEIDQQADLIEVV